MLQLQVWLRQDHRRLQRIEFRIFRQLALIRSTSKAMNTNHAIDRVLETVIYANDLSKVLWFYEEFLELELFSYQPDRFAFFKCRHSTVLIFNPEATVNQNSFSGGSPVPPHGTIGAGHVAFAVSEASLPFWRKRCNEFNLPIESEILWPSNGRSIYFRDPANNSIELATPNLWHLPEQTLATNE